MRLRGYFLYPGIHESEVKVFDVDVRGQIISKYYYDESDDVPSGFEANKFSYEIDQTYQDNFKKLKPNCRIDVYSTHDNDDNELASRTFYTQITLMQRWKLSWQFRRNLLQKSENIKWLISIPLSILTAYITTLVLGG